MNSCRSLLGDRFGRTLSAAIFAVSALFVSVDAQARGPVGLNTAPSVEAVHIGTFDTHTRIVLATDRPVSPRLMTLSGPDRLVIDMPEVSWRIPRRGGAVKSRLVSDFRFGLYQPGVSRLVLSLASSARVAGIKRSVNAETGNYEIDIELVEFTAPAAPAALEAAIPPILRSAPTALALAPKPEGGTRLPNAPRVDTEIKETYSGDGKFDIGRADQNKLDALFASLKPEPEIKEPATPPLPEILRLKPTKITIDPGHGAHDPGTPARDGGLHEKDVVLAFSLQLAELLRADPNFEVVMTRDDDTFVKLADRVEFAKAHNADLLLSVHADAFSDISIKGATAHTLSEDASLRASKAILAGRSRHGPFAGVDLAAQDQDVAEVVLDLKRRDTQYRSRRMAELVVEGLGKVTPVVRGVRHDDFHVLRTADLPAVLLELGFMSNAEDRERLHSDEWRESTAKAVKQALDRWRFEFGMPTFARR